MPQVKIVTDSSADVPPAVAAALGITVLPISINFGSKVFREGVDISSQEFFERIARDGTFPTTTPPPLSLFESTYAELMKQTNQIVSIHVSSKLSPTYARAQRAAAP